MGIKRFCGAAATLLLGAFAGCAHLPPVDCGSPVTIPDVVYQAKVLLLGEIHGTQEMPRFAGDIACHFAKRGQPVALALELPRQVQARIDAYLESSGDMTARLALVGDDFWRKALDGRATLAMIDLIERVRLLKSVGMDMQLIAMDKAWSNPERLPGTRDETMARLVNDAAGQLAARGVVIVLAGNVHTSRVEKYPHFKADTPMGFLLKVGPVLAFNVSHDGGTASIYGAPPEGKHLPARSSEVKARSFELFKEIDELGYSGKFHVGPINASPHVARAWLGL